MKDMDTSILNTLSLIAPDLMEEMELRTLILERVAAMVGDSLTSDIRGGHNAGLRTVWFNCHGKEPRADIRPDYVIQNLSDLIPLLEKKL